MELCPGVFCLKLSELFKQVTKVFEENYYFHIVARTHIYFITNKIFTYTYVCMGECVYVRDIRGGEKNIQVKLCNKSIYNKCLHHCSSRHYCGGRNSHKTNNTH